jgi:hypothetical protein
MRRRYGRLAVRGRAKRLLDCNASDYFILLFARLMSAKRLFFFIYRFHFVYSYRLLPFCHLDGGMDGDQDADQDADQPLLGYFNAFNPDSGFVCFVLFLVTVSVSVSILELVSVSVSVTALDLEFVRLFVLFVWVFFFFVFDICLVFVFS